MKKQVIALLVLIAIGAQFMAHFGYMKVEASGPKIIPNEAIRLRILANSDSDEDQALKRKVRDHVKSQIDSWVQELRSIDDARHIIQSRIPELEKTVEATLKEEGSDQSFHVEFGTSVKFPTKLYDNLLYPAGEYEAVLITLGEGEGANWWCVLFPPLCFLDFASGTAVPASEAEQEIAEEEVMEEELIEETAEAAAAARESEQAEEAKEIKRIVPDQTAVEEASISRQEETAALDLEETVIEEIEENEQLEIEVVEEEEVQVKFFLVEMFSSLFSK